MDHTILDAALQAWAPLAYQEDYDNSGWIVRSSDTFTGALLSLDCTEAVVDEAIEKKCDLIIAHHPIVFRGLKKLTGKNYVERVVMKAIRNHISIYAIHTNLDHVHTGVNAKLGEILGLQNCRILRPGKASLVKIVTFVPHAHAETVRQAMCSAGAGVIGNYDHCTYNVEGSGTFRAGDHTSPFAGEKGEIHTEPETRIEVVAPEVQASDIIRKMLNAHPYEEPAYDIYPLKNTHPQVGAGMVGELPEAVPFTAFLTQVKQALHCGVIRYSGKIPAEIRKIAVCGGSGFFLLGDAKRAGADIFITSDIKYHEFFDAEEDIMLADVGHYESEQYTKHLLSAWFDKNFPTFAILISEVNTNPVNYYY